MKSTLPKLAGAAVILGGLALALFRPGSSSTGETGRSTATEPGQQTTSLASAPPRVTEAEPAAHPASANITPTPDAPKSVKAPKPADTGSFARITVKEGQPIPELFPYQKEREQLASLGATYDAANIPAIASSLTHSDASVREAARQALVQIGQPSAIPHLENSKGSIRDPEEITRIDETIEFLSLPHVIDVLAMSAKAQKQK